MKNIIYILLGYIVFATLGLLTSCSKDGPDGTQLGFYV